MHIAIAFTGISFFGNEKREAAGKLSAAVCKGCGRTEDEVRDWPALSPWAKRAVWRRITREGTALRFTR